MKWPWNIGDKQLIKTILFVDDFVGTGDQFLKFINSHVDKTIFDKKINLLYCPLTAVENGLQTIKRSKPEIHLCPIEVVTEDDNFFNTVKREFKLDDDEMKELDRIYLTFMAKVKLNKLGKKGDMVKGYGGLALTYIYDHAAPNASLPLLWANSDNYTPLFSR